MKTLIRIAILVGVLAAAGYASADTALEISGPNALTYHVVTADTVAPQRFANKISGDGRLIDNHEYAVSLITSDKDFFHSETLFVGQDSVGGPMEGAMWEYGIVRGNWQIGIAAGAYIQDENNWINAKVDSFKMTQIGSTDVVPVIGVAVNYKIPLSDKVYLNINNVISAIITNTTVSVGWNF